MSAEENKTLVRRYFDEAWNEANVEVVDKFVATDFVGHFAIQPEPVRGIKAFREFMSHYFVAFPGMRLNIDDMLAEGNKVVTRWTARGTHKGALMGIPPTGKQVVVTGMWILRVAGGKIAEQWGIFDAMGMMQQLGVVPPPGEG